MSEIWNHQDRLNRQNLASARVKVGDIFQELLTAYNDLATKHNALLAKLDADVGVTDINYAATLSATSTALVALNSRP